MLIQVTWFPALLTLDEMRVEKKRNACCCCFPINTNVESHFDNKPPISMRAFEVFTNQLQSLHTKIAIILITFALFGFGLHGLLHLRMEFRPEWLIDPDSEGT